MHGRFFTASLCENGVFSQRLSLHVNDDEEEPRIENV